MAREGCEQEAGRCKAQQGSLFGSSRAEQGHGVVGQWILSRHSGTGPPITVALLGESMGWASQQRGGGGAGRRGLPRCNGTGPRITVALLPLTGAATVEAPACPSYPLQPWQRWSL